MEESISINEELKWSMYDEVVNGRKHELGELFKGKMNSFLQCVQKATEKGITNKDYIDLLIETLALMILTCANGRL